MERRRRRAQISMFLGFRRQRLRCRARRPAATVAVARQLSDVPDCHGTVPVSPLWPDARIAEGRKGGLTMKVLSGSIYDLEGRPLIGKAIVELDEEPGVTMWGGHFRL